MPLKIKQLGYDGLALPTLRCDSRRARFLTRDLDVEENQLDGVPVFSHVGKSRFRPFHSEPLTVAWRNRVAASRDKLARLMTPAQLDEAKRLAQAWVPKAP